jgi:hypothetical protein
MTHLKTISIIVESDCHYLLVIVRYSSSVANIILLTPVSTGCRHVPCEFIIWSRIPVSRNVAIMLNHYIPSNGPDSLVTTLAFLRDAGIFGRFLTSRIFRRYQVGFGTEHLKNDIRKCRYPAPTQVKSLQDFDPW